jgi:glycosyltransferase involved in cell wall biosynthesis
MTLANGAHVAFLTQDATPASDRWLAALLEGFEQTSDVGAVFGPHVARPDASHMIKAEMERHFSNWGDGGRAIDIQRLDTSPESLAAYRANPGGLTFFSSVNCCIARAAWEEIGFRDVPYAEDQLFGRELIEAGWAKVFHPDARVLHSHDYRPWAFLRRYFDEYRGLREVLGHREPGDPRSVIRAVRGLSSADRGWLQAHGVRGPRLAASLTVSARHHTFRMLGAILGSRADRMPTALRGRLSLEGRGDFVPVDVPPSRYLEQRDAVADDGWEWGFVQRAYPWRTVSIDEHAPLPQGPLTLAWVVPPWGVGSGGHSVIFHLVAELEARGNKCAVFVFDPFRQETRHGAALRQEIREHFVPIEAEVFRGLDDFHSADVAVATNWWTAYAVRDLPRCREKVYFVQDYESSFAPVSAEALWAEETYGMGYRGVAYTPWLADLLRTRHGMEVAELVYGTDLDTYRFGPAARREQGLVVVYGRQETPRRAVELAIAGLATLIEERPGLAVVFFGSSQRLSVPFPVRNLGVVSPSELAELYRRASIGVVFSLTNLSIVTQEMMASGLPVVELNGENVTSVVGESDGLAKLAAPRPDAIAHAIGALLDDPEGAAEMAVRARAFVEERTWTRAAEQLETALLRFLSTPRNAPAAPPERLRPLATPFE